MDPLPRDPLMHRLHVADPAAGLADPLPDRAAVRVALGRRTRAHRFRVALPAPVLAAGVTAVVLVPAGTPAVADIIDRAAAATAPPPNAIVAIRSRIEGRFWTERGGRSALSQDETAWVRSAADGRPRDVRTVSVVTTTEDPVPRREESTTSYETPGEVRGAVSRRYDPTTRTTTTEHDAAGVPRTAFDAHRLLEAAKRAGDGARLAGEATVGGRPTYRLVVRDRRDGPAVPGVEDRTEVYVDRETFEAVEVRTTSAGRTVPAGERFTSEVVQRVVAHDAAPDTAENRRVLELRGPRTLAGRQPQED